MVATAFAMEPACIAADISEGLHDVYDFIDLLLEVCDPFDCNALADLDSQSIMARG